MMLQGRLVLQQGALKVASRMCDDARSAASAAKPAHRAAKPVGMVDTVAGVAAIAGVLLVLRELHPLCRSFRSIVDAAATEGTSCCYDGSRRCCDIVVKQDW